jgi:hypothetical protein
MIYDRGFDISSPAESANSDELRRMKNLINRHFGDQSVTSRAASLGVFVHHGTTPHGVRLSIEYAMQQSRINFVACTSTLAQGVNLPIRYLIVSGIQQGGEKIKVRDFQNLVGRAGRSGMHTEGLIIFSDPHVYDKRRAEPWKFNSSVKLLSPEYSESTTSSLLELLTPLQSSDSKAVLSLPADRLCSLILSYEDNWLPWADEVVRRNPQYKFEAKALVAELKRRRRLIFTIESYLMANRGNNPFEEFKEAAEQLAMSTLAYHLASDEMKPAIRTLFSSVAEYVHQQEPTTEKQATYSKTLLGVRNAKAIEFWVKDNLQSLLSLNSNEDWLAMVWPLFTTQSDDKFFHTVEPKSLPIQIARQWLQGNPYRALFELSSAEKGTKPWGMQKPRGLTEDDIVGFCENTLGFTCALVLAAVVQFLLEQVGVNTEDSTTLTLFQKALKYGLPDWLSISCYEYGFADRVVAQDICDKVRSKGFSGNTFAPALKSNMEQVETTLKNYPSYFESVLVGLI